MRRKIVLCLLLCLALSGCTGREKRVPVAGTQPLVGAHEDQENGETTCVEIIERIWAEYETQEQFAVFGGMADNPVMGAAGALPMEQRDVWSAQYHIMERTDVTQGASLSHLLSGRLFTCVVFRVAEAKELQSLAVSWRQGLQESVWVSGAPQRLLLAKVRPGYLLLAYGSKRQMAQLQQKLRCAYPKACVLYSEPFLSREN